MTTNENADARTTRRHWLVASVSLMASVTLWLGAVAPAAAALVISPTSLSIELAAGDLGVVRGDITNTTGFGLNTDELFGSFSGYPSDALVVSQLLGFDVFALGDRTVTRGLDLFSVRLGSSAVAGATYEVEFFFSDINGNFSDPVVFSVTAAGPSQSVPEPASLLLVACGLAGVVRRRQRYTQQEA